MDRETRNYIENLAQAVIQSYDIPTPITDIDEVVKRMGGTISIAEDFEDLCDGTIRKEDNGFRIQVSPFQNHKRKAFTVAHELGHLFLHMGFRTDPSVWENQSRVYKRFGTSEQEYQANEFAAALLMPKEHYKEILDQYTEGTSVDIENVARYFNVSITAAINRGRFLGYLE